MNIWIETANELWHDRVGRHLGSYSNLTSLGGAYPMLTAKGVVRKNRIGAGTAGVILIDTNEAIVVAPFSLPDMPQLSASPVKVLPASLEFSLRKGVMDWVLDARRVFPLLAIIPGKASSLSALRLSHAPNDIAICSPGKTLIFDGEKVARARDLLLPMGKEGRAWKSATEVRQQIVDGSAAHMAPFAKNRLLEKYAQFREQFPDDFWLPSPGTEEFEALSEALIDRSAFPF